jgi:AraC-like DNA-binding protein
MAQSAPHWTLSRDAHSTLTGRSMRSYRSEPHLHDTYTIAFMSEGSAVVRTRGLACLWTPGTLFLANPYEVHEGRTLDPSVALEYEVFYPSVELVLEAVGASRRAATLPGFSCPVVADALVVAELSDILFRGPGAERRGSSTGLTSSAVEESLIRFFRRHADLLNRSMERDEVASVRKACRLMQEAEAMDCVISLAELASHVGVSRYYFIRLFHSVTGLAPNAYLRQLRLSKARRLICDGRSLAEAAVESGFADQAHLTREFKRVFGTTPGKIARDIELHPAVAGA